MPLSDAQIGKCLLILALPIRTDRTFAKGGNSPDIMREAEIVKDALLNVDAVQQAEIITILDKWTSVEFDTDTIAAEGLNSDPKRTRRLLRSRLWAAAGFAPRYRGRLTLERG
jgi:hypothetical protein